MMAAMLATRFPEKAPELFAYQASIVRAERNYEPGRWVSYDRQFRREALARKDLNWSVTDPRLYSEAFTGRAKTIPRCQFCLQDDHTGQYCPRNPDRPWLNWLSDVPPPHSQQVFLQLPGHPRGKGLSPNCVGSSTRDDAGMRGIATPTLAGTAADHIRWSPDPRPGQLHVAAPGHRLVRSTCRRSRPRDGPTPAVRAGHLE